MKPELISFDLCPFVQRSVITLLEKQVDFDITYIDLASPPQWFLDISPLGKVPALKIGDVTIFESAVINEYLDEINPPSMHPTDSLQKAMNKAWIEFASELLGVQYGYYIAKSEEEFNQSLDKMKSLILLLEAQLGSGLFFNGKNFSLIDAAFAPFFTRAALLEASKSSKLYEKTPKLAKWAELLVSQTSVIKSVKLDFSEKFMRYISESGGYAATAFK